MKLTHRIAAVVGIGGLVALGAVTTAQAVDVDTIGITSIDLENDTFVITNSGDEEADVNGLIMCNFPAYVPISGADPVPAGGTVTIDAGALGIDLADDQGELGLYTVSEFTNPDALLTYVEWGTTGHERASVAQTAGIWDGETVTPAAVIEASVDNPTSAAQWSAAAGDATTTTAAAETTVASDDDDDDDATTTTEGAGTTSDLPETGASTWVMAGIALALLAAGLLTTRVSRRHT